MNGIIRTLLSLKGRSSNSSLRDAPIGFGCSSVPNKSPCEESSHQSQLYLIFQNPVETEQLKFIILRILSFFAHRHHSQLGMITPIKNWKWLSIIFLMLPKLFMKMYSLGFKSNVFQCWGQLQHAMTRKTLYRVKVKTLRLTSHSKSCLAFEIMPRATNNFFNQFTSTTKMAVRLFSGISSTFS